MDNKILDEIQSLVPQENERIFLDTYLEIVFNGASDPVARLAELGERSVFEIMQFLADGNRQAYLTKKFQLMTMDPEINRFRIKRDLETVAFANVRNFLDEKTIKIKDRLGKEHEIVKYDLKEFSKISDQDFKAVKAIKYDKYGNTIVEFHDPMKAKEILARMEGIQEPPKFKQQKKDETPKLFDMKKAEPVEDQSATRFGAESIDADFVENISKGPKIEEVEAKKKQKLAEEEERFSSGVY